MRSMQGDEWKTWVFAQARTAKAGVVRADGRPHVSPVWVALDGDDVVFTTHDSSLKAKALRRDPRLSLCFDDETPPFTFCTIDGTALLSDDLDAVRRWATVIGGRYMGEDRAEEYGNRNGVPGELLVRVRPQHVVGRVDMAD